VKLRFGEALDPKAAVEALDLAGGGGRVGSGQDVLDTVLTTDAVEEGLTLGLGEAMDC
jgi:hypothetical protein